MRGKHTSKKSDLWGYKAMIGFCVVAVLTLAGIFYLGIRAKPVAQDNPTAGPVPIYFQSAKEAMPFPATLDPVKFQRKDIQEAYQVAKEIRRFLPSSPAIAIANARAIAASWTALRQSMRRAAISASRKHYSPDKCTDRVNRQRRSGPQSFTANGPIWGVQANDCDGSSTTSTKPRKGIFDESKTDCSKHYCVSYIFRDVDGGANANAGQFSCDRQSRFRSA